MKGLDHAIAVAWLGYCGRCGNPAPETRDNEASALQDAKDCPCKEEGVELEQDHGMIPGSHERPGGPGQSGASICRSCKSHFRGNSGNLMLTHDDRQRAVSQADMDRTTPATADLHFEIYADLGGMLRWRMLDDVGRALFASRGAFVSEAGARRSLAQSEPARHSNGRYKVRLAG